MSRSLLRAACAAAILLLGALTAAPARATPFVAIHAAWSVDPKWGWPQPEGIAFSCYGDATGDGVDGCSASVSLSISTATPTSITVTKTGGLRLTNITDHALAGYVVYVGSFSAFNPGGLEIGIGIDDPLTQAARFESAVTGFLVGDRHSCSIGFLGVSGRYVTADGTACGVHAPDSSQNDVYFNVGTLAPGASAEMFFGLSITYELVLATPPAGVPTPASALLLMIGMAGLTLTRRVRTL